MNKLKQYVMLIQSPHLSLTMLHKPLFGRFVVLDLETTGLSPMRGARIIEVSAREIIDGIAMREFSTFVNPQLPVPPEITALTGITSAMVRDAPPSPVVMRELTTFIGSSPIIAHNASFDLGFLQSETAEIEIAVKFRSLCTLLLSRRAFPGKNSYRLESIITELGIPASSKLHRASADSYVTTLLFEQICKHTKDKYDGLEVNFALLEKMQRQKIATISNWLKKQASEAMGKITDASASPSPMLKAISCPTCKLMFLPVGSKQEYLLTCPRCENGIETMNAYQH